MTWTPDRVAARAKELGPWFHNLRLAGVQTAPDHFLGDFPSVKWSSFADTLPADMTGLSVLDIGCNGGFYSHRNETPRCRARARHRFRSRTTCAQARFAAEVAGAEIEFRALSVYDVGSPTGEASTSCFSSACSTTFAIRCWRST